MIFTHNGKAPKIDPTAYIAPTAAVCGDVTIGPHCRVMFGASLVAEGGTICLGQHGIVLENAVIRSTSLHSTQVGDFCLIGPNAHLVGCTLRDEVFVATGAAIFHGALIGTRSEVRINAVVHLKTVLSSETTVPIGWVAVGDPAVILPPAEHEKIWAVQKPLNFPLTAYGYDRSEASMEKITRRMAEWLGTHREDQNGTTEHIAVGKSAEIEMIHSVDDQ